MGLDIEMTDMKDKDDHSEASGFVLTTNVIHMISLIFKHDFETEFWTSYTFYQGEVDMDVITDKTLESVQIEEVFFIKCTSSEIIVESVMLIIATISPDTVAVHNGYDFDFKVTVYSPPKYIDCFTEIRLDNLSTGISMEVWGGLCMSDSLYYLTQADGIQKNTTLSLKAMTEDMVKNNHEVETINLKEGTNRFV